MAPTESGEAWRVWDRDREYGDLLYRRATGLKPEMESSKSVAEVVKGLMRPGGSILDVGCGVGHYLRSLRARIDLPFTYTGVDATSYYIELARQAWRGRHGVEFKMGDVFSLPSPDSAHDIVISCNLFQHLPSIKVPLRELVRVAREHVLIRFLVGERSFRIQEVYSPVTHPKWFQGEPDEEEFDEHGQPKSFHYFNIYSHSYLEKLLSEIPGVKSYRIYADDMYDPANIAAEVSPDSPPDITRIIGGWQVNGYILEPWHFVEIVKGRT